ncbi:unnamed protein product, partial [Discosporangium mesarthrocarpum]
FSGLGNSGFGVAGGQDRFALGMNAGRVEGERGHGVKMLIRAKAEVSAILHEAVNASNSSSGGSSGAGNSNGATKPTEGEGAGKSVVGGASSPAKKPGFPSPGAPPVAGLSASVPAVAGVSRATPSEQNKSLPPWMVSSSPQRTQGVEGQGLGAWNG